MADLQSPSIDRLLSIKAVVFDIDGVVTGGGRLRVGRVGQLLLGR